MPQARSLRYGPHSYHGFAEKRSSSARPVASARRACSAVGCRIGRCRHRSVLPGCEWGQGEEVPGPGYERDVEAIRAAAQLVEPCPSVDLVDEGVLDDGGPPPRPKRRRGSFPRARGYPRAPEPDVGAPRITWVNADCPRRGLADGAYRRRSTEPASSKPAGKAQRGAASTTRSARVVRPSRASGRPGRERAQLVLSGLGRRRAPPDSVVGLFQTPSRTLRCGDTSARCASVGSCSDRVTVLRVSVAVRLGRGDSQCQRASS